VKGVVLHAPRDVRVDDLPEPRIVEPTDAILRLSATCVCGSDLWPYRGIASPSGPTPMGHEYCGIVEEVGRDVTTIAPGQFVIGSFFASDNTCPHCQLGYQTSCADRRPVIGAQAPFVRVPLADGTLVATREVPGRDRIPSMLAASDVLGTGWFAADAANVRPGSTVAVVGDGAVGLLAILSAKQMGAERIIAMSRHEPRQRLARAFGATDVVTERGAEGVERILELTRGIGADSVLECVGTSESMQQAIGATPACPTAWRSTGASSSSRTCICTAGPRPCGDTFRSSSSSSSPKPSPPVRSSISFSPFRTRRRDTARWTSAARSRLS
jgi:threonine dehydrogenase-like Zn-dependent dehydrogenase